MPLVPSSIRRLRPKGPRLAVALAACGSYAVYCQLRSMLLSHAERNSCRIGPRWLGLIAYYLLYGWSWLNGVRVSSEVTEDLGKLDPNRQYLIVWHPHGFLAWAALFIVSKMAVTGHPIGREWFATVAPVLFRIPVFSEALMLVNGRRVDARVVEGLLSSGANIAVQPGGVREQLASRHDQEQAFFPANLGFIKMAIKHGVTILPAYIFGENQLYTRVSGFDAISNWIYRTTGAGLPFATAKFGLPMAGLLPRAVPLHVRWGKPLEVGPKDPNPSEQRVQEVFNQYLSIVQDLFNKHKDDCLPPEVAAKGLKIVRADRPPPSQASSKAATSSKL